VASWVSPEHIQKSFSSEITPSEAFFEFLQIGRNASVAAFLPICDIGYGKDPFNKGLWVNVFSFFIGHLTFIKLWASFS